MDMNQLTHLTTPHINSLIKDHYIGYVSMCECIHPTRLEIEGSTVRL